MSNTSNYDPFEDTGDWPFRDAPPRRDEPRPERPDESLLAALGDTALEPPSFDDHVPDELAAEDLSLPQAERSPTPPVDEEQAGPAEGAGAFGAPVAIEPAEALAGAGELPAADEEPPAPEEPADEVVADVAPVAEEEHVVEELEVGGEEHAPGAFVVPPGPEVLQGGPHGFRRSVAVVVSRFNGDVTSRMLETTLDELRDAHVADDAITVVPVPGAFELPLAALALAKTRRFSCIVALGCVIRGETAHFDLVAGEAASGLQLAAIETGIPVSFGVITCDTHEQAEQRIDRAADAARTALEMADLFSHVRTSAASA